MQSQPRQLVPAGDVAGSSSTIPPLLSSSESASTPNSSDAARPTKKNASMACEACKVSKRKCDGDLPCSNCAATNKTCSYDPAQDGRRKQSRKRRLDELEMRSQALDSLLTTLKNTTSPEARQLLALIKNNASVDDILEFLASHPGKLADEIRETFSPDPPARDQQPRRMLTLTELTDDPTFKVPAAPWTTVTDDDFFVSHLVSAYLSWYHWYYHNFDENLFLEAMTAGDPNSIYCSPFLVNAVLAMGCMFSDHPTALATPGDASSRGLHFYNEAYRLWMLEAARPSFTNVQGFTIMIMTAAFSGKDRVSSMSLKQLDVMISQLRRQNSKLSGTLLEDSQRALAIIEWAAHIYATGFGTGFLVPPSTPKPSMDDPYSGDMWESRLSEWTPYPLLRAPIRLPLHTLYHYVCELYVLVPDAQALAFKGFATMAPAEKLKAAQTMDDRFLDWYRSMTPRFQFGDPEFLVVPATLDLALSLQHFRLMVWNWMIPSVKSASREATPFNEKVDAAFQAEADQIIQTAKDKCLEIVGTTSEILTAADASFGPVFNTLMTAQTAILAASFLLSGNLDSEHEEEMLLEIMRILVRCSRQRNLVKGITHMLLKTAEDQIATGIKAREVTPSGGLSKRLVDRLTVIVKDLAWEERDHLTFSSQYPNHINVKEDPDMQLSSLLESWAAMELREDDDDDDLPPGGAQEEAFEGESGSGGSSEVGNGREKEPAQVV